MKKSQGSRRGVQDLAQQGVQQPEKVGWIRKFCGRGIFRELWRSRYVVLRGDHLYISDKEVKDERKAQEVFNLADYERSEELRKVKSRSKKDHSRFTVLRCRQPGNSVPNLVFLAVSPEEKELWVNALNVAIIKAKNRVLDEVTTEEDSALVHPTRDRAKIPHGRRLPTRGHLMAVASTSSHGILTLDLVAEEDGFSHDYDGYSRDSWENSFQRVGSCGHVAVVGSQGVCGRQRAGTDVSKLRVTTKEPRVKTGSLPRGSERSWGKQPHLEASKVHKSQQVQVLQAQSRTPQPGKRSSVQGRSRCASMDEVLSSRPVMLRSELRSALHQCPTGEEVGGGASVQPVGQLQSLIAQRMQRAQELLEEMRLQELQKAKAEQERGGSSPHLKGIESPRLHHLRGLDSPHTRSSGSLRSRSSDSPRFRGKDSPRMRGKESPRSKAKRNRSKGTNSPRSRGSHSPATKTNGSPLLKDSPHLTTADFPQSMSSDTGHLPKLQRSCSSPVQTSPCESPPCVTGSNPPQVRGSDSPRGSGTSSPRVGSSLDSPCLSHKHSPSLSESFQSSQPQTPDKHSQSPPLPASPPSLLSEEDQEVERRRAEAERLLEEAVSSWREAQEVLQEVKELQSQHRRTYEKTNLLAAAAGLPAASVAAEEDNTATSPTSPDSDEESETS
uniref:pleckstrin homology domain-containing family O member 1-A isoform X2 n=1 Tax=Monopterus albus TaxID=43700 RepID=UPI0009B4BE66|nr:pleckstrin homology domain-containing family O member 1-A-like isoform X2 [Monopterus albus]